MTILNDRIIVHHQTGDGILIWRSQQNLEVLGGVRKSRNFYEAPNFFGSKGRLPCKPETTQKFTARKNNHLMTTRQSSQSSTTSVNNPRSAGRIDETWFNQWRVSTSSSQKSWSYWVQTTIYSRSAATVYYEPIWDSCCGGHAAAVCGRTTMLWKRLSLVANYWKRTNTRHERSNHQYDWETFKWLLVVRRTNCKHVHRSVHRPNSPPSWSTYTLRIKKSHNPTLVKSSRTRMVQREAMPTYHMDCS